MASSKKKRIDCSICKLTFDEDHGVWVCLECTEKLTNAINKQASTSPHPDLPHRHYSASPKPSQQQKKQESQIRKREVRRSSLPSSLKLVDENNNCNIDLSMTLFLEL
eukprot:836753_1